MSRLKKKLEETDLDMADLFDYDIEDKTLTPEEERKRKLQHRITAVAMILAVGVIGIAIAISPGEEDKGKKTKVVKETETTVAAVEEESEANILQEDQYPEITELVQLYYSARLTGDTASIEKYVDNIEDVDMAQIKASNEYIKKYKNIQCYSKPGLDDNTYVVFAYYEIKFKNIETLAPGIDVLYVIRDGDTGSVFIHNGATANADIKTYIEALGQEEDVADLYARTNKALQNALDADTALNEFYNALKQGTVNAQGN